MRHAKAGITVELRWWFRYYLAALRLGVLITGLDPDWDRVEWWIRRALVVRRNGASR